VVPDLARTARSGVAIGLLGPVEISAAASPPAGLAQAGLRILLALLAVSANRVVPTATLIDGLWQEKYSRKRERNLHAQVYQLRRRLAALEPGRREPRLITQSPGYRLVLGDDELDVASFTALAARGRELARTATPAEAADVLSQALALWRGPALADAAPACPLLAGAAADLEQQRASVLEDRVDADLAAGRHDRLAAELTGLVTTHPLRERLRGQLMISLSRCGRRADALEVYHQAQQLLNDEAGIEPGPQLEALYRSIQQGDDVPSWPSLAATGAGQKNLHDGNEKQYATAARQPAAGPGQPVRLFVPRQLPAGLRYFAGREDELAELSLLAGLADEPADAALVATISGPPGVGKSALAVQWAHQAAGQFPEGQLYVDLHGYGPAAPVEPAAAARGFLAALGLPADQLGAGQDVHGLLRSVLAGRRMLIVLDNARDSAQVRPLLPAAGRCLVIVTSRAGLAGLAAAHGTSQVQLGLLPDAAARELLAARLSADRLAADPDAVSQLIDGCAGLPLALANAGARAAATASLADLAGQLGSDAGVLDALETGDEATSVRSVLSWSYAELSEPAARLLRALGLHPGPDVTLPAAASMAAASNPQARTAVQELIEESLITERAPGRYAMHDLIRCYAAEQATATESAAACRATSQRLLDHYLHSTANALRRLGIRRHTAGFDAVRAGTSPEDFGTADAAARWLKAERDTLAAAVALAGQSGYDPVGWQLPLLLTSANGLAGWADGTAMFCAAMAAAERAGSREGTARVHQSVAIGRFRSGEYADAITHYAKAAMSFSMHGDLASQGDAELGIASSLGRQGAHTDALAHARLALGLYRTAGSQTGLADALDRVGWSNAYLADYQQAQASFLDALDIQREAGDSRGEASTLQGIGFVHFQLGEHAAALAAYQQALGLFWDFSGRFDKADTLVHIGNVHDAAGDQAAAQAAWQQALDTLGSSYHPDAARIKAKLRLPADYDHAAAVG
jgi:DNA-binding SARP family transcriptional activator